jgi:hypothetical protein
MRFFRRNATNVALAVGGIADSQNAPSYGWDEISIFVRMPSGGGTLDVLQRLNASSTYVTTDSFVLLAAGFISINVPRTGEHVRGRFTNGAVVQSPEIILGLK